MPCPNVPKNQWVALDDTLNTLFNDRPEKNSSVSAFTFSQSSPVFSEYPVEVKPMLNCPGVELVATPSTPSLTCNWLNRFRYGVFSSKGSSNMAFRNTDTPTFRVPIIRSEPKFAMEVKTEPGRVSVCTVPFEARMSICDAEMAAIRPFDNDW